MELGSEHQHLLCSQLCFGEFLLSSQLQLLVHKGQGEDSNRAPTLEREVILLNTICLGRELRLLIGCHSSAQL